MLQDLSARRQIRELGVKTDHGLEHVDGLKIQNVKKNAGKLIYGYTPNFLSSLTAVGEE